MTYQATDHASCLQSKQYGWHLFIRDSCDISELNTQETEDKEAKFYRFEEQKLTKIKFPQNVNLILIQTIKTKREELNHLTNDS